MRSEDALNGGGEWGFPMFNNEHIEPPSNEELEKIITTITRQIAVFLNPFLEDVCKRPFDRLGLTQHAIKECADELKIRINNKLDEFRLRDKLIKAGNISIICGAIIALIDQALNSSQDVSILRAGLSALTAFDFIAIINIIKFSILKPGIVKNEVTKYVRELLDLLEEHNRHPTTQYQ